MRRDQLQITVLLCGLLGALVILAASLPQLVFLPGRSFLFGQGPPLAFGMDSVAANSVADLEFWRRLIALIAVIMIVAVLIGLIFSAELRWELLRRIASVLLVFLLFYLALSALRLAPAQPEPVLPGGTRPVTPASGEPLPPFVAQPSQWLVVVVSVGLAALLIWGIWFFWRRGHTPLDFLVQPAQQALAALQAGGELHDTVVRCYLEMSHILSEQRGVARQRAMTPREFEQALVAAGLSDEHIRQLTRLFERVRYGPTRASKRDEAEAVSCLTAIVQAYRSGA